MYDVKNDNPSHKHACRREDQVKVKVYYRYQLMFLNIILVMKSLSVIEAFFACSTRWTTFNNEFAYWKWLNRDNSAADCSTSGKIWKASAQWVI